MQPAEMEQKLKTYNETKREKRNTKNELKLKNVLHHL